MTTTVVYAQASERCETQSPEGGEGVGTCTPSLIAAHPMSATPTVVQSVVATGSGLNLAASFASACVDDNMLIAILLISADNTATTTNPAGWALLSSGGTVGSRRIEVWYKRAASDGSGARTWTKPSGGSPFSVHMFELGGSFAVTLVTSGVTSFGTNTTVAASTALGFSEHFGAGGILAFVTSNTISAIGKTDGANTDQVLSFSGAAWDRGAVEVVSNFDNAPIAAQSVATTFNWTTSRPGHWVAIGLLAATGLPQSTGTPNVHNIGANGLAMSAVKGGQDVIEFDTSVLPDDDTISAATLDLYSNTGVINDPANAALEAWRVSTPDIPTTRGANNDNWYYKVGDYGALTKCAQFPAASTWTTSVYNSLTSESAFASLVDKAGITRLLISTDDLRLGTARTTNELYVYTTEQPVGTTTDPKLIVVHAPSTISSAGGIVTAEAFGGIAQLTQAVLAGSVSSGELFGTLRLSQYLAVGSVATGEAYGTLVLGSVLAQVGGLASSAVVTGIVSITTTSTPPGRYGTVTLSLASGGTVTVSVDKSGNVTTSNVAIGTVEDSI